MSLLLDILGILLPPSPTAARTSIVWRRCCRCPGGGWTYAVVRYPLCRRCEDVLDYLESRANEESPDHN